MFEYSCTVLRIIDGDTIRIMADLGFHVHIRETVRLYGIDTPEIYSVKKDSDEYRKGIEARDELARLLYGKELRIHTYKDKKGKFGRYLADVYVDGMMDDFGDAMSVNDYLVKHGFAKEYVGR